jgi:hypothetical protein
MQHSSAQLGEAKSKFDNFDKAAGLIGLPKQGNVVQKALA